MIRRPPRSTRSDTLFPYTPLFRSESDRRHAAGIRPAGGGALGPGGRCAMHQHHVGVAGMDTIERGPDMLMIIAGGTAAERSEERRVGKECVSTCRSRWSPDH